MRREAVKDAEQQRVLRLQELRRDWKCRFSGAAVSLRLDAVRQQVDVYTKCIRICLFLQLVSWLHLTRERRPVGIRGVACAAFRAKRRGVANHA